MKLVASLIIRNEMSRYLEPCVEHLQEFCDEVRILDDGSSDGSYEWLLGRENVYVLTNDSFRFFQHEGKARNALLRWTLEGSPTHILAIDADEFISDGRMMRQAVERSPDHPAWTLTMQEIWKADESNLWVRSDGGWKMHEAPILWRVPEGGLKHPDWRIADKALSCGREPPAVRALWRNALRSGVQILHFGWTNVSHRQARYDRYVEHDGGKYHASQHLRSIMFPDRRVRITPREWPGGLIERKAELLRRTSEV